MSTKRIGLVKRTTPGGTLINYGPLVVGRVSGCECLGHKEAFLLLGIPFSTPKIKHFYDLISFKMRASEHLVHTFYAMHRKDFDTIGAGLSRKGNTVGGFLHGREVKRWAKGEILFDHHPFGVFEVKKSELKEEPRGWFSKWFERLFGSASETI